MIEHIWRNRQTNKAFNALYDWNGYYDLDLVDQEIINQALDILRKAQEK